MQDLIALRSTEYKHRSAWYEHRSAWYKHRSAWYNQKRTVYTPNRASDMYACGIVHVQRSACSTPTLHVSMSTTECYFHRLYRSADSDDLGIVLQRHVLATDLIFRLTITTSIYVAMPMRTAIHKWNTVPWAHLPHIHACILHVRTCTGIIVAVSLVFMTGCLARHPSAAGTVCMCGGD
jgi:hypothetical protein